ncbi:low temperature requirement protein LtrA [Micromonospora pisi]|uniref:Low temperature requirement protein LtrA n=1 Tax=Micromonospora pisi TaxID=589240 RepID=A0A495JAW0_9ACTN|nr:low temperature requirement protein A [Micromonospora pisi]RKR86067.1 low temperature requirement protein LtrA [Micromonospora pisi]
MPDWSARRPLRIRAAAEGTRVNRLELFFDLVFVYAFFNIARATTDDLNGISLVHALLIISLLWWCWVAYAWAGNSIRSGEGMVPVVMFTVMAAIFIVALTISEAFVDIRGGLSGPLVFACCYFVVRILFVALQWHVSADQPQLNAQMIRVSATIVLATAFLLLAALLPEHLPAGTIRTWTQIGLWALAVLVEYTAGYLAAPHGWRIASAGHWAERFSLILLVAFGELIISVGVGGTQVPHPITWPLVIAAVLGIVITAALWWAYFDIVALAAEQALHAARGVDRVMLARDAYIYLHLPIIAGLMLLSLGGKEALKHIGDPDVAHVPMHPVAITLLYGGLGLYLLGHLCFQLRILGTLTWTRVGAIVLTGVLIPLAVDLPALVALGVLAGICVALVGGELILLAGSRRSLREAVLEEHLAHEARETAWRRQHR